MTPAIHYTKITHIYANTQIPHKIVHSKSPPPQGFFTRNYPHNNLPTLSFILSISSSTSTPSSVIVISHLHKSLRYLISKSTNQVKFGVDSPPRSKVGVSPFILLRSCFGGKLGFDCCLYTMYIIHPQANG